MSHWWCVAMFGIRNSRIVILHWAKRLLAGDCLLFSLFVENLYE
jgi:hypothetical protein